MNDADIAAKFGCTLTTVGMHHEDGLSWPEYFVECPGGNEGALVLLNELATEDARTSARVMSVAEACADYGMRHSDPSTATASQIQQYVQKNVAFREDPFQFFRPSDLTLLRRSGNCVNSARLVMATALAAGLPSKCVPVVIDGEIRHTAAQIRVNGVWQWAEATVTARFGEPPLTARDRGAVPCEFQP